MFTLLGLSQHELKLPARLRPKNKFEQQYHERKRQVFKIFGERRRKTVTIRFGDAIIGVVVSAPKCLHIGNLSVIVRRRRNIWLFLFNKSILKVKIDLSNSTTFATVIC